MAKGTYQIPFEAKDGVITRMLQYPQSYYSDGWSLVWKDNYTFKEDMQIISYGRGRSSAVFYLKSQTDGVQYAVFMSNMMEIIENCEIKNGLIVGQSWTFVKKGANYGMEWVKP